MNKTYRKHNKKRNIFVYKLNNDIHIRILLE